MSCCEPLLNDKVVTALQANLLPGGIFDSRQVRAESHYEASFSYFQKQMAQGPARLTDRRDYNELK
jgi:hypothetical protein